MRTTAARTMALIGAGVALLGLAAPAAAQADPPGNNGTVKIDGVALDDHPDNEPHVGCLFQVDFYGFDQGDLDATVAFTPVPPTADDEDIVVDDVAIGEDQAGGGTDLDASATYDLTAALAGVEPHAQQGIHLRLTVHAEGSQCADTKFKEFWVTGCGTPASTTTTRSNGTTTTTTQPDGTPTTKPDGTTTTTRLGGTTTPEAGPPSGGGATTAPDAAATDADQLPITGSDAAPLVATGLTLAAVGALIGVAARRLKAARDHG